MRRLERGHCRQHAGVATALVLILCMPITVAPSAVIAQDRSVPASEQQPIDIHIAEAARRFGIPQPWIRAVMEVESAGNPRAVSTAGAMGLMQIMPGTWAELRAAYGFGDDPFDRRDNILAGTAYLRQMYDRFGSPGFLAAYNAGPARYQEHLDTGRALPRETRNYLAILAPLIGDGTNVAQAVSRPHRTQDWRDAPLFAATAEAGQTQVDDAQRIASDASQYGIFVPLSRGQTP
ncbi:lytic transglycosylase domain-containing protein [Jannaschia sp. S6380]|uniref:lytic transglycosylase domain-containing protein n=1 Tax=Jannaschia sp. S6380 TaxID=2926408 RepID=UPI001FF2F602|nr:lytic transglycosylase domain-containing protein [Jannaschia sp. S6380]MCK0166645.1 lytic transglycosylase domain-containing protein [Jannaschia sp. S6380]